MIYVADISGCDSEQLKSLVCRERADYANRYKQEPDRVRSLGVAALLSKALLREGYTDHSPVTLLHDADDRPYIAMLDRRSGDINQPPFFSLSHAGDFVAVVLDDAPVGIDIERVRPYKESLAKRYFMKEEQDYIDSFAGESSDERDLAFTAIWTLKESFLKMTGKGLKFGLDTFSAACKDKEKGTFSYRHDFDEGDYIGQVLNAPDGYVLSVCMRTTGGLCPEAQDIHYVNLQEAI